MDVLSKKSYKSFNKISRYTPFPYYYHKLDDKYIIGMDSWLKDNTLYITHIVKPGDTYDSLALKYYNNPVHYWIICSFNRILDPYELPEVGSELKIPTLSNIEFDI